VLLTLVVTLYRSLLLALLCIGAPCCHCDLVHCAYPLLDLAFVPCYCCTALPLCCPCLVLHCCWTYLLFGWLFIVCYGLCYSYCGVVDYYLPIYLSYLHYPCWIIDIYCMTFIYCGYCCVLICWLHTFTLYCDYYLIVILTVIVVVIHWITLPPLLGLFIVFGFGLLLLYLTLFHTLLTLLPCCTLWHSLLYLMPWRCYLPCCIAPLPSSILDWLLLLPLCIVDWFGPVITIFIVVGSLWIVDYGYCYYLLLLPCGLPIVFTFAIGYFIIHFIPDYCYYCIYLFIYWFPLRCYLDYLYCIVLPLLDHCGYLHCYYCGLYLFIVIVLCIVRIITVIITVICIVIWYLLLLLQLLFSSLTCYIGLFIYIIVTLCIYYPLPLHSCCYYCYYGYLFGYCTVVCIHLPHPLQLLPYCVYIVI